MTWTEAEILALYVEHIQGTPVATLARRCGRSGEALRQQFVKRGLPTNDHKTGHRLRRERELDEARDLVTQLYKERGSIEAVVGETGLSRSLVGEIVEEIPDRERYRKRGARESLSREELLGAIRRAAEYSGEPLSIPGYRAAVRALGLPAWRTIMKRFGEWHLALAAAGVKANKPTGRRASSFTFEQCVEAVATCFGEFGGRVSYETYRYWAGDHEGVPSGPTVRVVCGRWNDAAEAALESPVGVC